MKRITITLAAFSLILLGSGCSFGSRSHVDADSLRQPAPPAAPVDNPEIPPEAKNVPKPY